MSLLFYKRPDYVSRPPGPMSPTDHGIYLEKTRRAIPPELSFEMVVSNRAMPPCSLQDFMGYLLYVSYDAENLQFYLWLKDYTTRFFAASAHDQALSPPWDEQQINPFADPRPGAFDKSRARQTDYKINFDTETMEMSPLDDNKSSTDDPLRKGTKILAESARNQAGLKWQPFTIQPFRPEIDRIISYYLSPGDPRELNLSQRDRIACLNALQHTTHPSALSIPSSITTSTLQMYSHPNFIRWATANGNPPRTIFGQTLGALNILFGFLIAILLTLSHKSRWWRIFAAVAWFLGFAFLLAGSNGICLVLYVTHDRHLRPWEQFTDTDSLPISDLESDYRTTLVDSRESQSIPHQKSPHHHQHHNLALETFGTANSYGHEVWADKYRSKMLWRKIFDRSVWVQNESVRLVQDRVAVMALGWGLLVSGLLTVLFTAVPAGRFF